MKIRFGSIRAALIICVALSTLLAANAANAAMVGGPPYNNNDGWPYDPNTDAADIFLSYAVTPTSGTLSSNISDMMFFNQYAVGGRSGVWWPANVDASGGTVNDPFPKSSTNMPLTGLITGLVDDSGATHLVLMVNNSFAALSQTEWVR